MANKEIKLRDAIDIPDKVAIGAGTILIAVSPIFPPAAAIGGGLIVGGGVGLGLTRAILPRRKD